MTEPARATASAFEHRNVDARIAIIYAFVASMWIIASDRLLLLYVAPDDIGRLSVYKGLAFVALTSLLLYGLLRYVSRAPSTTVDVGAERWPFGQRKAYVAAAVLTLLVLGFRETLPPMHALRGVMIVFLVPVMLGGLLGGLGPGLLATVLATVGVLASDLAGIAHAVDPPQAAAQMTRLGLFVLMGIGSSFICEALHRARRRAEALLGEQRRLNAEYRLLAEQLPDYVWRKDLEGRYVSCNSRFAVVAGRTITDMVGRAESEISFAEDAARWNAEDLQVAASRVPFEREQYWRSPYCDVGWVQVTKSPVLDEQGECIGIIGVARDVTARRATQEALRASERYFNALFVESIDAMLTFALPAQGPPGGFIDLNPAAERLLGRPREQLLRMQPSDILPELGADALQALAERLRQDGHLRAELRVDAGDETRIPVDVSVTLVLQRDDGAHVAMAVGRDMRERRSAEAERLRLQAQIIEMQKHEAIGQLTGGIAHDFNNLLATVLGYSELALRRARDGGDRRLVEHLDAIRTAGERGRDLVAKMLSFARSQPLEAAELPAPLDLLPVLEDSLRLLRATIPSSVVIELQCDAQLPAVQAARVDIEQVVMNLVINARDAMGGIGTLRIDLRDAGLVSGTCTACGQSVHAHCVMLRVEDSGPGIAQALRTQIFQPFFTTKEVGKGTGLGLAVVHGVVHRNGGHILLGDGADGARFDVLLPLAAATQTTLAAPHRDACPESGSGRHVVVVDDEPLLAEYWREVLSEAGYRVSLFADAESALTAFLAEPTTFDLVISDQTMPGMTGDVLAREIRERRPALPVVLCSGYSERLQRAEGMPPGVAAMLDKPVSRERMLEVLDRLLAAGP